MSIYYPYDAGTKGRCGESEDWMSQSLKKKLTSYGRIYKNDDSYFCMRVRPLDTLAAAEKAACFPSRNKHRISIVMDLVFVSFYSSMAQ